jgi:Uma2 family endonuclease
MILNGSEATAMATLSRGPAEPDIEYPSGDGKPVAETPLHRDILLGSVDLLRRHFVNDPSVYVSGNMLMYYVRGDKRRHVSPDVFLTRGIGNKYRDVYLVWEEGKGPDVVIEITSSSTKREDLKRKFELYRDVLRVSEYFLFDPRGDYLKPPQRGFRLVEGQYMPIAEVAGRLPSEVLGLHLERHQTDLRFHDPATGQWVPTQSERYEAAQAAYETAQAALEQSEADRERLRRERDELRRRLNGAG